MENKGQFKPGQSGNPSGRAKLPSDVLEAQRMTTEDFIRLTNKFLNMTKEELHYAMTDPSATVKELLIGSILMHSVKEGDYKRGTFILDRIIGKVPMDLNLSGNLHGHLLQQFMLRYEQRENES